MFKTKTRSRLSTDRQFLLSLVEGSGSTWSLARLSRALGRNDAYLHQFIYRNSPRYLPELLRHQLARLLSVPHSQLQADEQRALLDDEAASSDHRGDKAPFATGASISIPYFDIKAAAGAAHFIDDTQEADQRYWQFAPESLHPYTTTPPSQLALLTVGGESMSPLLEDGDTIMIDRTDTNPEGGGIFVLDDGHGLVVKRLELVKQDRGTDNGLSRHLETRIRIVSDNSAYVPYRRGLSEIRIIGRVIWMARAVR